MGDAPIPPVVALQMEAADTALLEAHSLRPCLETASFICSKAETCGVEVPHCKKAMWKHLKNYHQLPSSMCTSLWLAADRLSAKFPATHPLREKYKAGGGEHGCLPKLAGLNLFWCKKCPTCSRMVSGDGGLRKHCQRKHDGITRAEVRGLVKVPCQSLGRRRLDSSAFQVALEDCNIPVNLSGGATESVSEEMRTALSSFDPGHVDTASGMPESDREVSSFVSLAKCVQRLASFGLSLEQAAALIRMPLQRSEPELHARMVGVELSLFTQFGEARQLSRELYGFRQFHMVIGTSGVYDKKKPFRFLLNDAQGDDSSRRYARSAQLVVLVACRIYKNEREYPAVEMGATVREAVVNFMEPCVGEDEEDFKESLHRLLFSIFFEPGSFSRGSLNLFSSVVCACLCTTTDRGSIPHFSKGTLTGGRLSGIMYCVSCCATLEIFKYSPSERRDTVVEQVETWLGPRATVGVTNFVDLRSICVTVRPEEAHITMFRACNVHPQCGFIDGQEFSAMDIGKGARRMHEAIREKMFVQLLSGKQLPNSFVARVDAMSDDFDDGKVGYWALSDVRNESFVHECNVWTGKEALERMSDSAVESWCDLAVDVLKDLLSAMHLTAGGPGRGTEIGSLALRNTTTRRRSFYFLPNEVMIVPTFNKRRAMSQGKTEFLTRHMDAETSYLFKAFFLLIHPVVVVLDETRHGVGSSTRAAVGNVRDNILMGRMAATDVANVIGQTFSAFDIPFSLSKYRHLQRGLVKLKGSKSILRMVTCMHRDDQNEEVEKEMEDAEAVFMASVEQAGHSRRTAVLSYAQTCKAGDIGIVSSADRIQVFRLASQEWHVDLGLRQEGGDRRGNEGRSGAPVQNDSERGTPSTKRSVSRTARSGLIDLDNLRATVPDFETMMRNTVTDAIRNLVRSSALEGNGALQRFLGSGREEGAVDSALIGTGTSAGNAVGGGTGEAVEEVECSVPGTPCGDVEDAMVVEADRRGGSCVGGGDVCGDEQDLGAEIEAVLENVYRAGAGHGFDSKAALRRVTRPDAEFKSEPQKAAMEAVARRRGDLAVILATGGGKTAVVMGPCVYEEGVTVWVSPLSALLRETMGRLKRARLSAARVEDFNIEGEGFGRVLLVAPEEIGLPRFRGMVKALALRKQLNRVVVDEAHIAVMSKEYRECMVQLKSASGFGTFCPVVLLTATAPPGALAKIAEACGTSERGLEVIRGDPCRSNLAIHVTLLADGGFDTLSLAVAAVTTKAMGGRGGEAVVRKSSRFLIVCLTVADAQELGRHLRERVLHGISAEQCQVLVYHSKRDRSVREAVQRVWEAGKEQGITIMVATEGFATGTDAPDVRTVVFAGGTRSLVEFWQGAGRGGRDGNAAEVILLFHRSHLTRASGGEDARESCALWGDLGFWAERRGVCRRVGIERFLGGVDGAPTCVDREAGGEVIELCDACRSHERGAGTGRKEWWTRKTGGVGAAEAGSQKLRSAGRKGSGFQVSLAGRKIPSRVDIEEEMEHRTKRLRVEKAGIQWLRGLGHALTSLCPDCVIDLSQRADYKRNGKEMGPRCAELARRCRRNCCRKKMQCLRCMQGGHFAKDCDVIESVRTSGRRCCRRCFLISIGGESVHEANEFGKEGACRMESCTRFLMLCWSKPIIRRVLLSVGSPAMKECGACPRSAKDFADWLTMDGDEPAGLLAAMRWAYEKLELHNFGL